MAGRCCGCGIKSVSLSKTTDRGADLVTPNPNWNDANCGGRNRTIKWEFYKSYQNDQRLSLIYSLPYAPLVTTIGSIGTYAGLVLPNGLADLTAFLNNSVFPQLTNSDIIYVRVSIKDCTGENVYSEYLRLGNAIVNPSTVGHWQRNLYLNVAANSNITSLATIPSIVDIPTQFFVFRDGLIQILNLDFTVSGNTITPIPATTGIENFEIYTWIP